MEAKMKVKASFLAFLTVVTILFGVFIFTKIDQQQYQEKVRGEVLGQLRAIQAKLEGELNARLSIEKGLSAFVLTHLQINPQHVITQTELEQFGIEFMPQSSGIKSISLVQDSIITHVYPLKGNEIAIGANISLLNDQRKVFEMVKESRSSMLAGPVNLFQGGRKLISRTPIYWTPKGGAEAVYWGQVSLVLSQETLFAEAGLYDPALLVDVAIRGRDGLGSEGEVFWGNEDVFAGKPVIVDVKVGSGSWQLAAIPLSGWEAKSPNFLWIWVIGGFLAFTLGVLVWSLIYTQEMQKFLKLSEERFRQMFTKQEAVMYLVDPDTYDIIDANEAAQAFYGYSSDVFRKLKVTDLNLLSELEMKEIFTIACGNRKGHREFKHRLANGDTRDVEVHSTLIPLNTKEFFFSIVHDISERKKAEERLQYVTFHDSLTGLYARSYFDEEMHRLDQRLSGAVGLIVCDLDGLKLVNDTLGHESGDQMLMNAARILKNCFSGSEVVARIGGDEFVVIMKDSSKEQMQEACERLKDWIRSHNGEYQGVPVSLSIGFAISNSTRPVMRELFKEADNNMYREKLHRGQKARSAIVQTVVDLLAERDYIIEGHGDRLQEMVSSLAKAIGLSKRKINDLCLLAQFHDIGKVGVPQSILLKQDSLTIEETMEMRRHCEIGQRIALSSPDLTPIADWILKHQEWWDGTGYPLGLAGEDIPLECRILAIADAYDAMTNERPYRKALSSAAAIDELKRCAGTQFDPVLVAKFCEIVGIDS